MSSEDREFLEQLVVSNTTTFNILKVVEELQELSKELIQSLTKPDKDNYNAIAEEIADVHIQMMALIYHMDIPREKLDELIATKMQKLRIYKETLPNFGQI